MRQKGLSLYLKPGHGQALREGILITNNGSSSVRLRIVDDSLKGAESNQNIEKSGILTIEPSGTALIRSSIGAVSVRNETKLSANISFEEAINNGK